MKPRILMVDDEIDLLESYKRNLGRRYSVTIESSPEAALEMLKNAEQFQVIVSDYKMPRMNGIEFLIESSKLSPTSIKMLLTGFADVEAAMNAVNSGKIFRFMNKPIELDIFIKQIELALEQYRLYQSEKELKYLKTSLIPLISLEYRNPLSQILLSAELIEKYLVNVDIEQISAYIKHIKSAVLEMNRMIEEILEIGNQESNIENFESSTFDIVDLIKDIIQDTIFGMHVNHRIIFDSNCEKSIIHSSRTLIKNGISNLINNAVKFSPLDTNVLINLNVTNEDLQILISDEGSGIDESDIFHIFEPFFKGKNARDLMGAGVGLMIAKTSIERLGGEVTFESKKDVGSTFSIIIPMKFLLQNLKVNYE